MIRIAKHTLRFSREEGGKNKIITVKAGETFDFTIEELRVLNRVQPGVTKKLYGVVDNERPLPAGTPVVGDAQDGPEDSTKQRRKAPVPAIGTAAETGDPVVVAETKDIEDEL